MTSLSVVVAMVVLVGCAPAGSLPSEKAISEGLDNGSFTAELNGFTIDARDRLPRITARSLVVGGAHDAIPVGKGEEIAAGIPNAEFVLLEQSGHYAPIEEPEVFIDLVFSFLGVH